MDESVSVRVPTDLLRDLGALSETTHQSRSDVLREVLQLGLGAKRLKLALDQFQARKVSLGRAAELAGIPLVEFLEHVKRAGLQFAYDAEDLRQDLKWARSA